MQKGTVLINTQDIIGMKFNGYTVVCYSGREYSNTRGGERARHYYMCKHKCGFFKCFQRGQILAKIKPVRCIHCKDGG